MIYEVVKVKETHTEYLEVHSMFHYDPELLAEVIEAGKWEFPTPFIEYCIALSLSAEEAENVSTNQSI